MATDKQAPKRNQKIEQAVERSRQRGVGLYGYRSAGHGVGPWRSKQKA